MASLSSNVQKSTDGEGKQITMTKQSIKRLQKDIVNNFKL